MIKNVAAFLPEEARKAMLKYTDIRVLTLKILYTIPGYQDASLETKNYLYDMLSGKMKALEAL